MTERVLEPLGTPSPRVEGKVNILIVDDLHEKHVVLHSVLDELGENIVTARSGREALAQVLNNEFAVILLDVNMPDIDGLETASLIRQYKRSAQTPILFITAYVDEIQAQRGYALGAVDYIPSPVVPEVLRSKVRVFVELFRMNRQLQLRAAEREALGRAEAARASAEAAIFRADYLAEASQRLSRSLDLEQTVEALLDVSVPMLGDRAVLVHIDLDGHVTSQRANPTPPDGTPIALPAAVEAAAQQAAVQHRPQRWLAPGPADGGLRAVLVFPLSDGERPRRCLVLMSRTDFDAARTALATEVASRAAIALENARLYSAVKQADRRKNEFLAMLAHELRNPLAPIRNAVHIMRDAGVEPATLHWARDVISRQADHMGRLIDDLLDVSRIVQGKVVVKPESLDLAVLVERSIESSEPRLAARGQRLNIALPDHPVRLHGDPVRLAQVVSNLVNNASKFSPDGSVIELEAAFDGAHARISVRDSGCGIEPDFLPHIFELFVQGDQTLDRAQGGLGVGLTLVKHLVELHHGDVEAHSDGPGAGTEVRVRLPALSGAPALGAPQAGEAPAVTVAPQAAPGRRVLVVDDLAASAETLMLLLEMEGYNVRIAADGPSALEAAQAFLPDVVLLDIGLPGMNGFEVAQRLRAMPACCDALLVALTGYGEAESRIRSVAAGFDFHMIKPADVALLLSLIAQPEKARRAREA